MSGAVSANRSLSESAISVNQSLSEQHQVLVDMGGSKCRMFPYTNADTVRTLNEKIRQTTSLSNEERLELYAHYKQNKSWIHCCASGEELDNPDCSLVEVLKNVNHISLQVVVRVPY